MLGEGGARRSSGEKRRRYLKWGRIGITIAAVAYLANRVDPNDVLAAFEQADDVVGRGCVRNADQRGVQHGIGLDGHDSPLHAGPEGSLPARAA